MFKESDQIEKFEPKVWLSSPTMHGEEFEFLKEAYETNWMSTVGANINEVERLVCKKIGCKYAVGLSAGTAALHMAVKLAGVKPGEKVFCSDMTFSATVNPIVYEGGVPVFIDTEYDTWNMDPEALEKAFELYPDVKVVVIAHLYGTPGKVDELRDICEKHGAVIIEDAAESMGATYKGLQTGTFGKYNAISFNGNKIITGSSGGMLLTDDKEAAEKVRKWSTQSRENAPWYQHEELWLPDNNADMLRNLTILGSGTVMVSSCIYSLFSIFSLTNKVRINSIALLVTGVLSTATTFFCLKFTNLGVYAIVGVSSIFGIIRNLTFTPIYAAKSLNFNIWTFYPVILKNLLNICLLMVINSIVKHIIVPESWMLLVLNGIIDVGIGSIITLLIMFNKEQRTRFLKKVLKRK